MSSFAERLLPLERGNLHSLGGVYALFPERERIAYRVTPLPDIRRVVRVKAEKRKRWLTREVVLETGQDAIKRGEREGKMTERAEREVARSSRKLEIF